MELTKINVVKNPNKNNKRKNRNNNKKQWVGLIQNLKKTKIINNNQKINNKNRVFFARFDVLYFIAKNKREKSTITPQCKTCAFLYLKREKERVEYI
jgi:hypothetical protein